LEFIKSVREIISGQIDVAAVFPVVLELTLVNSDCSWQDLSIFTSETGKKYHKIGNYLQCGSFGRYIKTFRLPTGANYLKLELGGLGQLLIHYARVIGPGLELIPEDVDVSGLLLAALKEAEAEVEDNPQELTERYEAAVETGKLDETDMLPVLVTAMKELLDGKISVGDVLWVGVTTDALRVRSEASLSGYIKQVLPRGSRVHVYETVDGPNYVWAKIGDGEWVAKKFLKEI